MTGTCDYVYECAYDYTLHDRQTGEHWRIAQSVTLAQFAGWSSADQSLLFSVSNGYRGPLTGMLVVDPATRNERELDYLARSASWSPRGDALAFATSEDVDCGLWLGDAAGGPAHRIPVDLPLCPAGNLAWTPDGRRLVFNLLGAGTNAYSVRLDGSDLRLIAAQAIVPPAVCAGAP